MGILFSATDPIGYKVFLDEDHWLRHIVGGDHSIMEGNEDAVKLTIEDPDYIFRSTTGDYRDVYFRKDCGASYSDALYTKVVTDFSCKPAEVVSAWPQDSVKGSIGVKLYERD